MGVFCKRRRKAVAPLVLAFWLFAVILSVAQACGMGDELAHAGQKGTANVVGHDRSRDGAPPCCAKFCSDDIPLLAKVKAVQDPTGGHALATLSLISKPFPVATAPLASILQEQNLSPGIAVSIRFLRLTL